MHSDNRARGLAAHVFVFASSRQHGPCLLSIDTVSRACEIPSAAVASPLECECVSTRRFALRGARSPSASQILERPLHLAVLCPSSSSAPWLLQSTFAKSKRQIRDSPSPLRSASSSDHVQQGITLLTTSSSSVCMEQELLNTRSDNQPFFHTSWLQNKRKCMMRQIVHPSPCMENTQQHEAATNSMDFGANFRTLTSFSLRMPEWRRSCHIIFNWPVGTVGLL